MTEAVEPTKMWVCRLSNTSNFLRTKLVFFQMKEAKSGCEAAHPAHPPPPPLTDIIKSYAKRRFFKLTNVVRGSSRLLPGASHHFILLIINKTFPACIAYLLTESCRFFWIISVIVFAFNIIHQYSVIYSAIVA